MNQIWLMLDVKVTKQRGTRFIKTGTVRKLSVYSILRWLPVFDVYLEVYVFMGNWDRFEFQGIIG